MPIPIAAPAATATMMIAISIIVMVPPPFVPGAADPSFRTPRPRPAQIHKEREIECVGGKADGRSLTKERRLTARRRATRRETVQEVACVPKETLSTAISPHITKSKTPPLGRSLIFQVRALPASSCNPTSPFTLVKFPTLCVTSTCSTVATNPASAGPLTNGILYIPVHPVV